MHAGASLSGCWWPAAIRFVGEGVERFPLVVDMLRLQGGPAKRLLQLPAATPRRSRESLQLVRTGFAPLPAAHSLFAQRSPTAATAASRAHIR